MKLSFPSWVGHKTQNTGGNTSGGYQIQIKSFPLWVFTRLPLHPLHPPLPHPPLHRRRRRPRRHTNPQCRRQSPRQERDQHKAPRLPTPTAGSTVVPAAAGQAPASGVRVCVYVCFDLFVNIGGISAENPERGRDMGVEVMPDGVRGESSIGK